MPSRAEEKGRDKPHRLDGVREDDLLIRVALLLIVAAVVDELHLLENGGLREVVAWSAEVSNDNTGNSVPCRTLQHQAKAS